MDDQAGSRRGACGVAFWSSALARRTLAPMLNSAIVRTVEFCTRHIWGVIIVALILAGVSGTYTVRHFAIDTNVNNLISRDLPWRKRELEYQAAFPQNTKLILVVVE